ncbi:MULTISPECIES: permease prefix domain 1-containing protein [Deinococcus]|uniref:Permease prefix domain 1-containing protein n=1 Tax=Deinococcus rufus TaxID=2136097 RepID=A0ABV7Z296_9DEIO|nr:permease prefix domain 1-containing protein [Deinococcus sp. AB2017081]WQE95060.1 permease prefix domain 1-containing protein [Deinococcus sp. AB2017081]
MNREEQFLRGATRGLGRRARLAAQAELRSHLHERVQALRLEGMTEATASAQAMRELGHAGAIRRSLWGAHPPLHLLWWGSLGVGVVLTALYFRDVQVFSSPFPEIGGGYGVTYASGDAVRGLQLDSWQRRLPPQARITDVQGVPALVVGAAAPIPLRGGADDDRPLLVELWDLPGADRFAIKDQNGNYRPAFPWLEQAKRVRGPYLKLARLGVRAYRAGYRVRIDGRSISGRLGLNGVALPGEVGPRFTDWTDHLHMRLVREDVRAALPSAHQRRISLLNFEINPVPGDVNVIRAEPGRAYVLVGRVQEQVLSEGRLETTGEENLLVTRPIVAGPDGILRLPAFTTPYAGRWTSLQLYPDVAAWAAASVASSAVPALLIEAGPEYVQGMPLRVAQNVVVQDRPYEIALVDRTQTPGP